MFDLDGRTVTAPAITTQSADHDRVAPQKDGSFSIEQLWRFIGDLKQEPDWREASEVACAYYDGDQYKTETLQRMKELGILPIINNMMKPIIDSVSGMEIIQRADLKCVPEDDESYETAMAINVKFKQALRMTRFNQKVSEQFKQSLKGGIDWLEVGRNPDPFEYRYKVTNVPWREMYVDYLAREPDYSDARYIIRARWYDFDDLVNYFPKHKKDIMLARGSNSSTLFSELDDLNFGDAASSLASAVDRENRCTMEEAEWRETQRGRARLYEILYYVPRRVEVIRTLDDRVMELDYNSQVHLEALQNGFAEYGVGVTKQWRRAYHVGPHRLVDHALKTNAPHYIPMVAFRKDGTGEPYGLGQVMKSPQDAINARNSRALHDQSSRRYKVDQDAVDNHEETRKELNKANAYIIVKPDRLGGGPGIEQMPNMEMANFNYQLLQEAKDNIYETSGLYREFVGGQSSARQSGVAIEELIEQSTKVLGPVWDNYKAAKTKAGERLFQLIIDDMTEMDNIDIKTDTRLEPSPRVITINAINEETGMRDNDITLARMQVALEDAPQSATYMKQKFMALTEVIKSLPPEIQAVMSDLVVRAAALPEGEEIIDRIREITGYGPEPKDPQKRQQVAQQQQQRQQMEQAMQEMQMAVQDAELKLTQAKAMYEEVRAQKLADADTELTEAKTLETLAKADLAEAEQTRKGRETDARIISSSAQLMSQSNQAKKQAEDKKTDKKSPKKIDRR